MFLHIKFFHSGDYNIKKTISLLLPYLFDYKALFLFKKYCLKSGVRLIVVE